MWRPVRRWKTRKSPSGPVPLAFPEAPPEERPGLILDAEGNSLATNRFDYLAGDEEEAEDGAC